MGVTIHYRGKLDDPARVEEFEDRVLDVVAALGGQATIWRSFGQEDPSRMVRGLLVQMCPGQDTLSLLISPEGELLNLFEIKEAEQSPLPEPPYCFVKTQFGSLQGHVAVVSLLDALRAEYFTDLEVTDESGYYEHRDSRELARKLNSLGSAILALGEALEGSALSPEAAEDPEILAARIQRVAELVSRKMQAEGKFSDRGDEVEPEAEEDEPSLEELVRQQSQARRQAELRQERLMRRLEEGRGQGLSTDDALRKALREARGEEDDAGQQPAGDDTVPPIDPEELRTYIQADLQLWLATEAEDEEFEEQMALDGDELEQDDSDLSDEPWRESLGSSDESDLSDDNWSADRSRVRHPAHEAAERLYLRLADFGRSLTTENGFYRSALNGAGELLGGLVQATGRELDSRPERAAVIVQLKRALKGLAFCRGGVYGLRAADLLDESSHREIQEELRKILEHLHELLTQAWGE
jgi:hypothetical protein